MIIGVGLATLLLVVIKLFLIDLSAVSAIWRIVLFLGFGALFLVVSYFFQGVLRADRPATPEPRSGAAEGRAEGISEGGVHLGP
jgi:uncharacterized membrane protein